MTQPGDDVTAMLYSMAATRPVSTSGLPSMVDDHPRTWCTSAWGDSGGLVNPTWSEVRKGLVLTGAYLCERLRVARPMLAGKPHEAVSNGPRWMAAGPREWVHRTRPTGQLARRLS
jgi:hypothetical protein